MKKILFMLLAFGFILQTPVYSFELYKKTPKQEIKSTLRQYHKALSNHDIKTIKSFYDKNYRSSDGFNLDELIEMLEKTYSAYKNLKYKTKITAINASDNWAMVSLSDKTSATVYPVENKDLKKEKMGKLSGKSVYNIWFKKEGGSWKIVSDDILLEETSLKYGIANKMDMNLIAPMQVQNGQDYDLSLKIDKPKNIIALASISREEISYPPLDYQEKFRKIPEFGELERIVKANGKNLDEYAIASIGLTKVSVNEAQTRAKIEILGMAYIMKRVNMNTPKIKNEILVGNKNER